MIKGPFPSSGQKMDLLEITLILLTSSVVAAVVSVLLNWAQSRNLERYGAEIRLATFRRETQYAKLHERRAEVLAELYRRLARAQRVIAADGFPPPLADPENTDDEIAERELSRLRKGIDVISQVRDYYQENRLFFSHHQREMMEEILSLFQAAWLSIQDTRLLGDKEAKPLQGLRHGNRLIHQKIVPLMEDLDSSFKAVLGFNLPQ
jgi:hypothetical protein